MVRTRVKVVAKKKDDAIIIKKKKNKKIGDERSSVAIPRAVGKRVFTRSGTERVAKSVFPVLDTVCQEQATKIYDLCVRAIVRDGRSTIQPRDLKRALDITGIKVY
jgi:histone H3/H4